MIRKLSHKGDIFEEKGMTKSSNDFVEATTPPTERTDNSVDIPFNGINPTEIRYKMEPTYLTTATDTQDENLGFILVPLLVLMGIVLLSALVYLMARNRRRIAHVYYNRKNAPAYTTEGLNADLGENSAISAEDYDDIDDPTECLLKGKLQIDRNSYSACRTTIVTEIGSSNELYA